MVKHPASSIWVKRGLVNSIEGLYLAQRMQRQSDTPESALALAGFKNTAPFLAALGGEAHLAATDKTDSPASPFFAGMTFNTFVQTDSYVPAVELVFRVCRDSPYQSKFPTICGRDGQGKTHLLHATAHEARRIHPEKRIALVNMLDLAIALVRARRRGNRSDFIKFLCALDTLLIDDIQLCEADSQLQASLLEVMERQPAQVGHRLVLSCDVNPGQLQLSESRLKAAFETITLAEVKPLVSVERSLMVGKLAGGFNLPAQTINYIADKVTGNVGELKAAVTQLIDAARDKNREISLELTMDIVSLAATSRVQKTETTSSEPESTADKEARELNRGSQVLKEIIRSARNKSEHILANEIVLSQMISVLSYPESAANRQPVARLQLALQAIREGDLETASEMMQSHGSDLRQSKTASIHVSENAADPKMPRV